MEELKKQEELKRKEELRIKEDLKKQEELKKKEEFKRQEEEEKKRKELMDDIEVIEVQKQETFSRQDYYYECYRDKGNLKQKKNMYLILINIINMIFHFIAKLVIKDFILENQLILIIGKQDIKIVFIR